MKRCFRCGQVLPLTEFYRHPRMTDGHLGKCKDCTRADVQVNRRLKRKQYSLYEQERFQTSRRKEQILACARRRRIAHPEKVAAYRAVRRALRR